MSRNERLQALRVLQGVLQDKTPLTHLLNSAGELTPFTRALCFGVCRHYQRLQILADRFVDKRPQTLDIWLVLLMGLYQLQYLNKPEYATVQETVGLLDKIKKTWAKGLINAVLRRFCREREAIIAELESNPAFVHGHPDWFVQRVQRDWPTHWEAILHGNDQHPPMSLRVNQQQGRRDDYLQALRNAGLDARALEYSDMGIALTTPCDVTELPGFATGAVSVQDEAAQLAVSLLDLRPGLRVLDACCAPGGKTCHILESEAALAECVALDIDAQRLQRVRENLTRLQLTARVLTGDALQTSSWWDGSPFDRILLDAPCSATGVIRRHPDIKLLRSPEDIQTISALQAELLERMWPLLKDGGLLLYATCSIMPSENDDQIARFVVQHPDCRFVSGDKPWGLSTGHGWQILPGQANCDGFFYSLLRKDESQTL